MSFSKALSLSLDGRDQSDSLLPKSGPAAGQSSQEMNRPQISIPGHADFEKALEL